MGSDNLPARREDLPDDYAATLNAAKTAIGAARTRAALAANSELIGLYSRLRWTLRPGSDFYLVYSHNWLNLVDNVQTLNRSSAAKLSYTHRF